MPRVKTGPYTRQRRKGWKKAARGYWGGRHRLYKTARMAVLKGMVTAYKERRRKKRVYRALWIVRLSAALKTYALSYSKFINLMKKASVELDRRMLSEMAIRYPDDFAKLVELARAQAEKLARKS
jgi:large subunit ribosomal protein L20